MLITVIVVLLALTIVGAAFGHSRWGYAGWSPAGVILVVVVVLWVTGNLHG